MTPNFGPGSTPPAIPASGVEPVSATVQAAGPLEVHLVDGAYAVTLLTGRVLPIQHLGEPVRVFSPDWVPLYVISAFAPVYLLVLRRPDGLVAMWFLDQHMVRIGGRAEELRPGPLNALRSGVLKWFRLLMDRLVSAVEPEAAPDEAGLDVLSEGIVRDLLHVVLDDLVPGLQVLDLRDADAGVRLAALGLQAGHVQAAIGGSVQAAYRTLMRTGTMPGLSPFDGDPVAAAIGLVLQGRRTAYRFIDPRCRRSFYVVTFDLHDTKFVLYVPDLDLCCIAGYAPDCREFVLSLVAHMMVHRQRLVHALSGSAGPGRVLTFVNDYPVLHIGHAIWNELSALDELVATLPPAALPFVCVLNSENGTEVYGPLDVLFPELDGKVLRPAIASSGLAAFVYDNGFVFIRATTLHVSASMRRRIQEQVLRDPRLEDDRAMARRLAAEARSCILLGLRVGNRTIPDFTGFLIKAIDHLVHRLGPVTIVLDGNNARLGLDPSTVYGSFGPAEEEPLLAELRIVFALRRHYLLSTMVVIVGTVGAPIACSLFWIMQSRFFVAPWGAGLAKYRWICNRPGFVVTNRFNLHHAGGDLHIYDAPAFMEAPTLLRFIAIDHVADAPGHQGFYANFVPDADAVAAGLDRLIADTTTGPSISQGSDGPASV